MERGAETGSVRKHWNQKRQEVYLPGLTLKCHRGLFPLFLERESDLRGFYVYTDHLFFLNCHCEGAVIKRLSQRHERTLPVT